MIIQMLLPKKFIYILSHIILLTILASCKKKETDVVEDPAPLENIPSPVDYTTPFDQVPETKNIVMYEVNLRAFNSGHNLQGVINRLDYLQSMHVNVVWLMPIYPIGELNSVNSPYCVKDFTGINDEFGNLNDLRILVHEAHTRGMAVILDWVANHTAWDNSWITHTDWYTQDGSGNIIIPPGTNWADVADLNFENSEMRLSMIAAMKYWITEANVDGFRCDYADGIPFDFWTQSIDSLRSMPGRNLIMLAEGARDDHYTAGFDMTYSWDFYGALQNVYDGQPASGLYFINTVEYASVPTDKMKLRFTTNHDESAWNATPMTLFNGAAGATAASVVTTFLQGVPMIYTGQEVGTTSTIPFFTNSTINWSSNSIMLENYREMLGVYVQSDAARYGMLQTYNDNNAVCFKKNLGSEEILIVVNIRNSLLNYTIPSALSNTTWTNAITGDAITLSNTLSFGAYEYLILKH